MSFVQECKRQLFQTEGVLVLLHAIAFLQVSLLLVTAYDHVAWQLPDFTLHLAYLLWPLLYMLWTGIVSSLFSCNSSSAPSSTNVHALQVSMDRDMQGRAITHHAQANSDSVMRALVNVAVRLYNLSGYPRGKLLLFVLWRRNDRIQGDRVNMLIFA